MKRRITLSVALALSVLASLLSLPATAQGQQRQRFTAHTGVLTIGPGQILRVTLGNGGGNWDFAIRVRFRRVRYIAGGCNGDGVCRQTVAAQDVTAPATLNADEAASIDVPGDGNGVQVMAEWSSNRDVRVIAQIIDAGTGRVVAISVPNDSTKLD